MRIKIFLFTSYYTVFSHFLLHFFFRDRQRSYAIGDLNIIRSAFWKKRKNFFNHYSLFQQRIKCIRTNHSKCDILWLIFRWHWWRWWWGTCWRFFDAFSLGHSQYLAFSLDGGGLGGPGDKGRYPLRSIHFLLLVIEVYWMKKAIYTIYIHCQIGDISRRVKRSADVRLLN